MRGSNRMLAVLGLLSLAAVTTLAIQQTRAEPLFFLSAPRPQQVRPVVEASPAGLSIYFGLLAADGRETRGDGQVEMVVSDGRGAIYRNTRRVRRADFAHVRLADRAGWRWSLVCGFGWLAYHDGLSDPAAGPGQVEVTFTTAQGATLHGSAAILFPG